jgi:hypothetical protein
VPDAVLIHILDGMERVLAGLVAVEAPLPKLLAIAVGEILFDGVKDDGFDAFCVAKVMVILFTIFSRASDELGFGVEFL